MAFLKSRSTSGRRDFQASSLSGGLQRKTYSAASPSDFTSAGELGSTLVRSAAFRPPEQPKIVFGGVFWPSQSVGASETQASHDRQDKPITKIRHSMIRSTRIESNRVPSCRSCLEAS